MRITACRIEAFGPFQGRAFETLDYPVVVVQGPNEAGKTSLFHFFREMLYGLAPPDAARHPYASASESNGPALGGHLRYRLADGTHRAVHRRLLGSPRARLTGEGRAPAIDLQNRPLPAVAHVSRDVFSSVYALSGRALEDLRASAWEEVQARLLRMVSTPGVRPVEDAVAELEKEAARAWTPSASGGEHESSSAADRHTERRRALRRALKEARAHDRERRALHEALAASAHRLEALQAERTALKSHLRRAERLRPVHALVTRMEAHVERAGDLSPFEEVPEEPAPVLRRLEREIEHYEAEERHDEEAREEAQATCDAFTPADRRIEREADTIRAWTKKTSAHESRAAHRESLLREGEQITGVLDERARRLFERPWSDALAEALRALPEDELETRVEAYRKADSEVDALEVRADTLARKVDRRKRFWPWAVVAAMGLTAFVLGLVLRRAALWGLGSGLAAVGLLQIMNAWSYNHERTERLGELDLEIEEKAEERAEKSAAIAELIDDLPLSDEAAAKPGDDLWSALYELRRQVEEREALRRQAETLGEALHEAEASVAALAEQCGVPPAGEGALSQTVAALEKRLQAAEARHREADAAEAHLATLRRRRRETEPALEKRRARRDALQATLRGLDDDLKEATEELAARRRAAHRAEQARATLFREHPGWEALREEIRALEEEAGAWDYADEDVVQMQERREAVTAEILHVEKQRARRRADAERLVHVPTPADVASKLAATRRRLAAAEQRRDRLTLLANVLRRADGTFRRTHQPDVVKQAGRYLRTITGGRYHRLVLEGEDRRLRVCRRVDRREGGTGGRSDAPEGAPQPVAPPLSQGLRDQVYASLRLALLDHLDQSQEALPVFLDEVFTAWDYRRRQQGYAVIEELAERRQVFVFTCHPALSEEMHRRLGAHRLLLEAPPAEAAAAGAPEA